MKHIKKFENVIVKELTIDYLKDIFQPLADEGIKYTIRKNDYLHKHTVGMDNVYDVYHMHLVKDVSTFTSEVSKEYDRIINLFKLVKHITTTLSLDGFGSTYYPELKKIVVFSINQKELI